MEDVDNFILVVKLKILIIMQDLQKLTENS